MTIDTRAREAVDELQSLLPNDEGPPVHRIYTRRRNSRIMRAVAAVSVVAVAIGVGNAMSSSSHKAVQVSNIPSDGRPSKIIAVDRSIWELDGYGNRVRELARRAQPAGDGVFHADAVPLPHDDVLYERLDLKVERRNGRLRTASQLNLRTLSGRMLMQVKPLSKWAVSPDGTKVAVSQPDTDIEIVDIATGEVHKVPRTTRAALAVDDLAWSSRAGQLLVQLVTNAKPGDHNFTRPEGVATLDVESGALSVPRPMPYHGGLSVLLPDGRIVETELGVSGNVGETSVYLDDAAGTRRKLLTVNGLIGFGSSVDRTGQHLLLTTDAGLRWLDVDGKTGLLTTNKYDSASW